MIEVTAHDDVLRLRCSTRVSRGFGYEVSAYLVRGVLVDTGFPNVGAELARWLAGRRVEGALLTHYHEDHAGNVDRLLALGIPVGMAAATEGRVLRPGPIGAYRRVCWGVAAPLAMAPAPFVHDALSLLPSPGHTDDHHVVWDVERGTLFGGDLYLGVKVRIAHPGEDVRGQSTVLRQAAALAPERFFDGHRGLVERPVEQLLAKAQWIDEIVGAIERRHAEGWSPRAIEREVLGGGDLTGLLSRGDYAKRNIVESVLRQAAGPVRGI